MRDLFRVMGLWGAVVLLSACETDKDKPQIERPLDSLYGTAFAMLQEKKYEDSADEFLELERQHPYSPWAAKAQLMAAYALYQDQRFDRAIGVLDNFILLHPYHEQVSYAYYLRALCYYDDIPGVAKDPKVAEMALSALEELLNRFPDSKYKRDAQFKRDYVAGHLAGHAMSIGRFYEKQQNYLAAFLRFQSVVRVHPRSVQIPEALHRLVECSLALGLRDEAKRAGSVLGHSYPESSWYSETYRLLGDTQAGGEKLLKKQ